MEYKPYSVDELSLSSWVSRNKKTLSKLSPYALNFLPSVYLFYLMLDLSIKQNNVFDNLILADIALALNLSLAYLISIFNKLEP